MYSHKKTKRLKYDNINRSSIKEKFNDIHIKINKKKTASIDNAPTKPNRIC